MQQKKWRLEIILVLLVVFGAKDAFADWCVSCIYDETYASFRCYQATQSGFCNCFSDFWQDYCDLEGWCDRNFGCLEGDHASNVKLGIDAHQVLTNDVIMEIASKHPRFAMVLIALRNKGTLGTIDRIHVAPVEITPKDIEARLNSERKAIAYSSEPTNTVHRKFLGKENETVYDITLEETNSHLVALKLQVNKGSADDLTFPVLYVHLAKSNKPIPSITKWEVKDWQISPTREMTTAELIPSIFRWGPGTFTLMTLPRNQN